MMLRQRVTGDYLQTAAIIRDGAVMSAVNDPNDYRGPLTGYRMSLRRWAEVSALRSLRSKADLLADQAKAGRSETAAYSLRERGSAPHGNDPLRW